MNRGLDLRAADARGFTLVEVVVVLVILATIAAFVTTSIGHVSEDAREDVTRISMGTMRDVMVSSYRNDVGKLPRKVADLQLKPEWVDAYSPRTRHGWRGPYVRPSGAQYVVGWAVEPLEDDEVDVSFSAAYGLAGDPAVHDGYGLPIVLQIPDLDGNGEASPEEARHARLVSAGFDRVIDTPPNVLLPSLTVCDDDVVLYLEVADTRGP